MSGALDALRAGGTGLGLDVSSTRVVDHDERWSSLYDGVARELTVLLADVGAEFEHVGSTAVRGLRAKPILDMAIGIPRPFDGDDMVRRLEEYGLRYVDDLGLYGGLFFRAETDPGTAVLHVHVVGLGGFQWRRYLAFRDALRHRNELSDEYSALKTRLAERHPHDRASYLTAKSAWVAETLDALDPPAAD